jgi:hypothetical protein
MTSHFQKHDKFISAHEVGHYAFCPESYRLSQKGAKVNKSAQKLMAQGDRAHEAWARGGRSHSLFFLILALLLLAIAAYFIWGSPS